MTSSSSLFRNQLLVQLFFLLLNILNLNLSNSQAPCSAGKFLDGAYQVAERGTPYPSCSSLVGCASIESKAECEQAAVILGGKWLNAEGELHPWTDQSLSNSAPGCTLVNSNMIWFNTHPSPTFTCDSANQPCACRCSASCVDCPVGKFSAKGESCTSCPSGKSCPPGSPRPSGRWNPALWNQVSVTDPVDYKNIRSLVVSPDGISMYAATHGGIVYWQRDMATGALTNQIKEQDSAPSWKICDVVVSSDNKHVYAVANSNNIFWWDRNTDTGALTNYQVREKERERESYR